MKAYSVNNHHEKQFIPDTLYDFLKLPPRILSTGQDSLSGFVQQPTRALKMRLEVLASEIFLRLDIRQHNQEKIQCDMSTTSQMVDSIRPSVHYGIHSWADLNNLVQRKFDLEKEARSQDVECWQDITKIIKDFLDSWDSLEKARSLALLIDNERGRTSKYL